MCLFLDSNTCITLAQYGRVGMVWLQCPTALRDNHLGYCYHFAAAAGAALGDMEKALQLLRAAEWKTTLARRENAARGAI